MFASMRLVHKCSSTRWLAKCKTRQRRSCRLTQWNTGPIWNRNFCLEIVLVAAFRTTHPAEARDIPGMMKVAHKLQCLDLNGFQLSTSFPQITQMFSNFTWSYELHEANDANVGYFFHADGVLKSEIHDRSEAEDAWETRPDRFPRGHINSMRSRFKTSTNSTHLFFGWVHWGDAALGEPFWDISQHGFHIWDVSSWCFCYLCSCIIGCLHAQLSAGREQHSTCVPWTWFAWLSLWTRSPAITSPIKPKKPHARDGHEVQDRSLLDGWWIYSTYSIYIIIYSIIQCIMIMIIVRLIFTFLISSSLACHPYISLLSPLRIQNWHSLSDVEISSSASLIAMAVFDPSLPSRSRSPAKCSPQGASGARNGTCPADPATKKTVTADSADSSQLIGLDFDCTITVRHFYKSVANLLMGKPMAHPHCAIFHAWLKKEGVKLEVPQQTDVHWMVSAVETLSHVLGADRFRHLIRAVFLGGEERIQHLTAWFARKDQEGIHFAIITAGVASSVSMALEAVPEWDRFFPTDVVLDLSQSRHQVPSITGQKALILRDLRPMARIVLVDDSLREDPIPTWILRRSQVKFVALPYEGTGLNLQRCADVDAELLHWSSKNPSSALAAHCRSFNQLGWWWPRGRVWHTRAQVAFFALNSATWPVLVKVVCESKVHQSWFCGKCLQKTCSNCVMGNDMTAIGNEKSNAIIWKLNIKGTSGDVLNVLVFTSPVPARWVSSVSSQSQRLQLRVLLKLSIILAGSMVEIILEHAPRPVQDMLFNTG